MYQHTLLYIYILPFPNLIIKNTYIIKLKTLNNKN